MLMSKSLIGWKLHMQSGHYSTVTINGYLPAMQRVISYLEDPDAAEVTPWDLDRFLVHLREDGVSESTRQYYWKVIKSYFSWASKKKGLGIQRPDEELEMPHVPEPEVQPYTKEEIQRLLKACIETEESLPDTERKSWTYKRPTGQRDRLMILMLLDTGMRVSELCRLQYKDIDLNNQSIHIRSFETGRKSRDRIVFVGSETMDLLWKYIVKASDPESYLFNSSTSRGPLDRNGVDHLLKRLGKKAGVSNCGAHRFRHTFAIQYLRNGGDIYTLKRLIGHRSFYMVQRYLHLSDVDAKKAHQKASPVDNWL